MTVFDALETIWQIRKVVEDVPGRAMFADLPAAVQAIKDERDDLAALNDKLSDLLRRTAIAIKGPEPELTVWDWSDLPECAQAQRDLIVRAINEAISSHRYAVVDGKESPSPTWVIVKGIFCHGSTVSAEICRQYGFDPEQEIGADE